MSRLLPVVLCLLLVPAARAASAEPETPAAGAATAAQEPALVVAVLPLESNAEARDEAAGVTALLVSRLAESPRLAVSSPSDHEAVRTAGACEGGACEEAKPGAPGSGKARYVVTGRLDGFGSRFLLTTSLVDSETGRALSRPHLEVASSEALPRAAVSVADQLLAVLIPNASERALSPEPSPVAAAQVGSFIFGLRFNNSLISNFASFNPGGHVEIGYQFHPEWVVFGQVGLSYVRSNTEGREGGLNVVPGVLGLRHYHNIDKPLRPYWGLGLGVQLSFGEYGIFQQTGPLPTVIGFIGLEYLIIGHLGVQLEASTNLAQATLGLTDGGLGNGLNLDLNAGIAWHF